jgi:hypothetical protein
MSMATPTVSRPARRREWWARPGVVLPVVGALVLLVALLTPQPSFGRIGDPRLSSHLAGSLGARALSETAARFGFAVVARDRTPVPDTTAPPGTSIHAVLAPPLPMTPADAHVYLERVRAGDGLLFTFDGRTPLGDSLGIWRTPGGVLRIPAADSAGCGTRRELIPPLWPDGRVHLYGVSWVRGAPPGRVVFASVGGVAGRPDEAATDAAVGFPLGRGRVVALADPDLLRNDVIRRCAWGTDVAAMRMLEWLRAGGAVPRTTLDFDEFHHGFGSAPSARGVVAGFLVSHPVGRGVLQLALAGLVLLLALAPRALPPQDVERVERRDPLEQVDALAHAYEQVGASRTIAVRLLRGVRRRVEGSASSHRARSDADFLADARAADPALRPDVALVERALRESLDTRELAGLGPALHRIEHSLTITRA